MKRRTFIKTSSLTGAGIMTSGLSFGNTTHRIVFHAFAAMYR